MHDYVFNYYNALQHMLSCIGVQWVRGGVNGIFPPPDFLLEILGLAYT